MTEVPQAKTPLIDRMVSWLSPRAGAERAAWRTYLNTYQGGIGNRNFPASSRNPSYPGQSMRDRLQLFNARDVSRDIDDNSFIGRGVMNRELDNVVADGPTLQCHAGDATADKPFRDEVEERWRDEFMPTCDITGMCEGASDYYQMQYRTARRDGDGGEILTEDDRGNPKLQIIPADRICNPDFRANSPILCDGVELDANGAPYIFHVLDNDEFGKRIWRQFPADDFVYTAHRTKPFQIRGEPCFAQTNTLISNLDRYIEGVGLAAWMATVFGIIFKEKNAGRNQQALPFATNSAGNQQRAITFESGMMKYAAPEDEYVQVDAKQPMQQTPDWIRMMARLIGLPFDMPLELVLLDVSQANLSSLRGGLQQFYRSCRKRRAKWIAGWDRKYRWWISKMAKNNKFSNPVPAKFWPHKFQPVGWQFSDPIVQTQGVQLECDIGINSLQNVCDELGRDYELITEQRKQDAALTGDLPRVFSTLTRESQAAVAEAQSETTQTTDAIDGPINN